VNLRSGVRPAAYPCWKDPEPRRRGRFSLKDVVDSFSDGLRAGAEMGAPVIDGLVELFDGLPADREPLPPDFSAGEIAAYLRGVLDGKRAR
jgi:hypothetical protein